MRGCVCVCVCVCVCSYASVCAPVCASHDAGAVDVVCHCVCFCLSAVSEVGGAADRRLPVSCSVYQWSPGLLVWAASINNYQ